MTKHQKKCQPHKGTSLHPHVKVHVNRTFGEAVMSTAQKLKCVLFGGVLPSIILVVMIRTLTLKVRNDPVTKCNGAEFIPLTEERLEIFRQALRFQTVSTDLHTYNTEELERLGQFIVEAYPTIHSSPLVTFTLVADYSLLYRVQGQDLTLTPYLLASHLDVVPADPDQWEAPPFAGDVVGDFVYGRGTIDDKHGVMGILEALEHLLSTGFQPRRSFYIAFGHDEEVNGLDGAASIARHLKEEGVHKLEFVCDEGLTVLKGLMPGISKPVALIGTTEKGFATLKLKVEGQPGHSSMPGKESSLSILANAVSKLTSTPHPSMFGRGPEQAMLEHVAQEMSFAYKMVMTNLWLFGPLVSWSLSQKPSTNAMVRTVTAVTRFSSGIKDNVIPPVAEAIVNHRIHPAQTLQEVLDYDRQIINDDRVKIEVKQSMEAPPVSPHHDTAFGYQIIKNSIRQVFTDAVIAPGVLVGNTDTVHYLSFTPNVYRFSPTFMLPDDLPRFHGNNERISKQNYEQAINFYHHLMLNADQPQLAPLHHHGEEL